MLKRRHFILIIILLITIIFSSQIVFAQIGHWNKLDKKILELTTDDAEYSLNGIIVKYKKTPSKSGIKDMFFSKEKIYIKSIVQDTNTEAFTVYSATNKKDMTNKSAILSLEKKQSEIAKIRSMLRVALLDPNVEYAQPIYIYKLDTWTRSLDKDTPSDWDNTNHWYYDKQKVAQMWQDQDCSNSSTSPCGGDSNVIVAVLDTGLAYETRTSDYKPLSANDTDLAFEYQVAPEFSSGNFNLYTNTNETDCTNGIDDDGNGYIDDCNGYNAYEEKICSSFGNCTSSQLSEAGHPNDDFGHGTFVTGGISSNIDNGGSTSPAFNVTLMPVKVFERITQADNPSNGPVATDVDVCNGVKYAVSNGANVLNMSFGSSIISQYLQDCLTWASDSGVVLVASSGNSNTAVAYPAALSNVIAVGSSDNNNNKATYSNYGSNLDIVAAVGDGAGAGNAVWQQSYSCLTTHDCYLDVANNYKTFSNQFGIGTSYASPAVSAAAALLLSNNNSLNPEEVRFILRSTAQDIDTVGFDNDTGYGLLNFEALNNFSTTLKKQYFTWYDTSRPTRHAWILVGNPSTTTNANVNIHIEGTSINENFIIPPGGRVTPEFRDIKNGPVVVTSDIDVFASQRVMYEGSFNEYAGIPATDLTTDFYFTWYDTSRPTRHAWILVGNPSTTTNANVNIRIEGTSINENYIIPPGGRVTPEFRNIKNGPVIVTSDINVFASQRVLIDDSFNEFTGISTVSLSTEYYFTWYDTSRITRNAWILVGNPSTTTPAHINIKVGDGSVVNENYIIPAGGRITPEFRGLKDGPIIVTSDINIFTSQRILINGSFNEYSGIPTTRLTNNYFFPWYDTSRISRDAWILIGNPSATTAANVNVKIGDGSVVNENYIIPAGGRITPEFKNIKDGPVIVTSDINIFTSQRVIIDNSFNEYPGISF